MRKNKPTVFIETSAFVRFLTRDDEIKYKLVRNLFAQVEAGTVKIITSNVVWFELIYVTSRVYKLPVVKLTPIISQLRETRSLTTIETTNTPVALALWQETKLPYGDCLIATQVPGRASIATFDADFKKLFPTDRLYQW